MTRVLESPESEGTHALVEIGPQVLGPQGEGFFERRLGPGEVAGGEQDAANGVMFPGRAGRHPRGIAGGGLGHGGEAQRGGMRLPCAVEDMAGAEQRLGLVEQPEAGAVRLGDPPRIGLQSHAEVRPDDGQVEQVVPELLVELRVERRARPIEQRTARSPEGAAVPLDVPRRRGGAVGGRFGESQAIDDLVQATDLLQAIRHPEDPGQFLLQAFAAGESLDEGRAASQARAAPG